MKECAGTIGRLFGHKFETLEVSSQPPEDLSPVFRLIQDTRIIWDSEGIVEAIDSLSTKRMIIKCVRCGEIA
jgi:hypothetical protein